MTHLSLGRAPLTYFICQVIVILFFGLFTEFNEYNSPMSPAANEEKALKIAHSKYPLFQDVHVMIFVGFGFLMVFLKNNSWCSIGFNYLIACWAIQICILFTGFWH
jgi:ammonium transporter Rh